MKSVKKKKIRKIRKTEYPPTYIISYDPKMKPPRFILKYLRNHLNAYHLTETTNPNAPTTFLFLDEMRNFKLDPKYYNTKCWLSNVLSDEKSVITNKFHLYNNMKAHYPHIVNTYMAPSYSAEEFIELNLNLKNKMYIVKPSEVSKSSGFGGRGVFVINTPKKLDALKTLATTEKNIIVSEYITNPLLFHKRKFHLRIYYIISTIKGVFRYFVYPKYKILTAKEPFVNADYGNQDIHDTHFKSTNADYIAPDNLPTNDKNAFISIVQPKLDELFRLVSSIVEPHCHPYPNAANAYEILGCDVMITDTYDVVLLEINDHIGHNYYNEKNRHVFSYKMFNLINENIFKHAFI